MLKSLRIAQAAKTVLDVALPPRCFKCGAMVADAGNLCSTCWPEINFIAPPVCAACGLPFEYDEGTETLCGACHVKRPDYGRARSALRYDDASRGLILAYKHGDRTHMTHAFADWMVRAGAELADDCDLLVPVPLHWTRLFNRRYNQSALLAHAIGKRWGKPVAVSLLIRRKRTPVLGKLSPKARAKLLAGAFQVPAKARAKVKGRHIVLVDDVLTSGATASACARVLSRAGAAAVDVLTFARVDAPRR